MVQDHTNHLANKTMGTKGACHES